MRLRSPRVLRPYVRSLRYVLRFLRGMLGRFPRTCTVCGHHGRFLPYGAAGDELGRGFCLDALCPRCLSLERHRLLALCDGKKRLFTDKRVLHFAPEPGFRNYLKKQFPAAYVSCDLSDPSADLQGNVEALELGAGQFDVVICLHVLEHVDDRRALPELHRVLDGAGLLVTMVPVVEGWPSTFEDAAKITKSDRLLYFGQHDHVRFYGRDIRQRLQEAGFAIEEFVAEEPWVSRHGLTRGEVVFLCRKNAQAKGGARLV